MNVMAIGAHPDDIEFGCSGTIVKHVRKGDFVVYVCMTSTSSVDATTDKVIRSEDELTNEVLSSVKVLGVRAVKFLQFKDLHVPFSFESVSSLEKIIKEHNIDTIYTHWAGDSNQDHISTFKTTMAAARYVPNVFCYEQIPIPRHTENPMSINYYSDITNTFETKMRASKCHKSQFKKYEKAGFDVEKNLKTMAQYRGIQANCEYAEAFQIIKMVGRD
jgi:LmbE family N-acetylglucosaminyl deacetylase